MLAGVQWVGWLLSGLLAFGLTFLHYYWFFKRVATRAEIEKRWVFPVIFRFLALWILLLLVQGPWVRLTSSVEKKPRMIVYLDSSESVTMNDKLSIQLAAQRLKAKLSSWDVETKYFASEVKEELNFSTSSESSRNSSWARSTNAQKLFEDIQQEHLKYGLQSAVIMSDGMVNAGLSPQSLTLPSGLLVSAIGIGDTVRYPDVFVKSLLVNKEVFVGNSAEVELVVGVKNTQSKVNAVLMLDGSVIQSQSFVPSNRDQLKRLMFALPNQSAMGLKSVQVKLTLGEMEKVTANNSRISTFRVVDNRKTIGLVGDILEPDMGAIRRSLQGYDPVKVSLLGTQELEKSGLDAVVLFGVPMGWGSVNAAVLRLKNWLQSGKSVLIFPKRDLDLAVINELSLEVSLSTKAVWQDAQVYPNGDYSGFELGTKSNENRWLGFSPLICPLQNFSIADKSKVLLYQRWLGEQTAIPMQWIESVGKGNLMVCLGSGFWRWGMLEQKKFGDQEVVQQWIRRSLGVLTAGVAPPKRLRIELSESEIDEGSFPAIRVVYRDMDGGVNLQVKPRLSVMSMRKTGDVSERQSNTSQPVSLALQSTETGFRASGVPLKAGVYQLQAEVEVGGEKFSDKEILVVNASSLEKLEITADLSWLKALAAQHQGVFQYIGSQKGNSESDAETGSETGVENGEKTGERIAEIVGQHTLNTLKIDRVISTEIRNRFWYELVGLLLAAAGLLGLEWSFRKWLGKY